ncbi:hypothetical protein KFK09_003692 [Dendrobium nobile]|uniref:Uncharacterized protein n=1 Tax=Dendrobium nobile TaxID=94219 RepID=A0A8T3BYC8_DENNO|nr:hypothetical protein KFK09_003692 [Dendrobium nobile]
METLEMAPVSAWAASGESLLASAGVHDPEKWAAARGREKSNEGAGARASVSPGLCEPEGDRIRRKGALRVPREPARDEGDPTSGGRTGFGPEISEWGDRE